MLDKSHKDNPYFSGDVKITGRSILELYEAKDSLHGSLVSIHRMSIDRKETKRQDDNKPDETTCFHSIKTNVVDILKLFDFKMLKDLNFILYLAMAFMLISGMVLSHIIYPSLERTQGYPMNKSPS